MLPQMIDHHGQGPLVEVTNGMNLTAEQKSFHLKYILFPL